MRAEPRSYSLWDVIVSETIKLRTVRSTLWAFAVFVVLSIGLGALASALSSARWATMTPADQLLFDPARESLIGVFFGQFAIGVLGVLVVTAEYSTGTIRASLAAVPKTSYLVVAKTLVFGAFSLLGGECVAFVSFFVGQALLRLPAPHATFATPGALRAVVGDGVYLALLALFAVGIGTAIRHTAAAISVYVSVLLVAPVVVALLPSSIANTVTGYLPATIGTEIVSRYPVPDAFSLWVGLSLLAGYALGAVLLGGVLISRRDV